MSLEEQINTRLAMAMDRAGEGPISITLVPDHSQVDAYLASLRGNPAQTAMTVSPSAIAPELIAPDTIAPDATGGFAPGAVAPDAVAAAQFAQSPDEADGMTDVAASRDAAPPDTPFGNSADDTSLSRHGWPDATGQFFAQENDIRLGGEQASSGNYDTQMIPQDRKSSLTDPQLGEATSPEQRASKNISGHMQPEELDSINQQATSGPGTTDGSEPLKSVADDIAEMKTLLATGVDLLRLIQQLLQTLKAM